MSGNYTGRGNNAGPATEFYPLSGSTASSPSIVLTATIAAAAQTIHTGDANAQDVLFVTVANAGSVSVTVFGLLGTTATTAAIPVTVQSNSFGLMFNGNATISRAGAVTVYATTAASSGISVYGYVARTYTATG